MNVVILDTETTGLTDADEPVSVGMILVEVDEKGGLVREIDRYYGLREPSVPIHPGALRVHGIRAESLSGMRVDLERIASILSRADVAVAHNASFDARMIAKIAPHKPAWRCSLRQFPWVVESGRKLDQVCESLGVPRPQPHNALTDCEALLACLLRRTGKTERSRTYLGALLAMEAYPIAASARPPRPAPRAPMRIEVRMAEETIRYRSPPPQRTSSPAPVLFGRAIGAFIRFLIGRR